MQEEKEVMAVLAVVVAAENKYPTLPTQPAHCHSNPPLQAPVPAVRTPLIRYRLSTSPNAAETASPGFLVV